MFGNQAQVHSWGKVNQSVLKGGGGYRGRGFKGGRGDVGHKWGGGIGGGGGEAEVGK